MARHYKGGTKDWYRGTAVSQTDMNTGHLFTPRATCKVERPRPAFRNLPDLLAPFASLASFHLRRSHPNIYTTTRILHILTRTSTYHKTPSPPHPSRSRTSCIAVTEMSHVWVPSQHFSFFGCKLSAEPSDRILDRRESSPSHLEICGIRNELLYFKLRPTTWKTKTKKNRKHI